MHWVLVVMLIGTPIITWQGYATEARCQAARSILLRQMDVPRRRTACFPSDDAVPDNKEAGDHAR